MMAASNMHKEEERVKTFNNHWPLNTQDFALGLALARNGFYHFGTADYVRCAFCKIELSEWENGHNPRERHTEATSGCPMLSGKKCGNIPLTADRRAELAASMETKLPVGHQDAAGARAKGDFGIDLPNPPKDEETRNFDARKQTYTEDFRYQQRITEFCLAGFKYTGSGDAVECFHCGIVLENFNVRDDVWREHARWNPGCGFVKSSQGSAFIKECRAGMTADNLITWEGMRTTIRFKEDCLEFLNDRDGGPAISEYTGFKRCLAKKYTPANIRRAYQANNDEEFIIFDTLDEVVRSLDKGVQQPLENYIEWRRAQIAGLDGPQPAGNQPHI